MDSTTKVAPLLAWLAIAIYAAVAWPVVVANHGHVSVFVQAGSRFVDPARLQAPIQVLTPSAGYDGQFYYRMAVSPFSFEPVAGGIRFDAPVYRSQRFLYPLLAWLVSLGRPGGAAVALFATNLLGIGAIAWLSLLLTRALRITRWAALAIVSWPGFLVALTHDTSEIIAGAFLLGALLCYVRRRLAAYVALGMAATLTRETTAITFAGILLHDAVLALAGRETRLRAACGLLLLLPFAAWHESLPALWHETSGEGVFAHDFGWPLVGIARVLDQRLTVLAGWASLPMRELAPRVINLVTTVALLGFCATVASSIPAALRRDSRASALAIGWLATIAFLSLLTAGDGPWATPTEFCRAFSECWTVGCLVLCAGVRPRPVPRLGPTLAAFGAGMWLAVLLDTRWAFGLHLRLFGSLASAIASG